MPGRAKISKKRNRGERSRPRRSASGSPRDPKDKSLRHRAYHEAGHAVMGVILGHSVERVSIERDGESAGHTIHLPVQENWEEHFAFFNEDTAARLAVEREVVCTFAGEAATYVLTGRRDHRGTGRRRGGFHGDSDYSYVLKIVDKLLVLSDDPSHPQNKEAAALNRLVVVEDSEQDRN